MKLRKGEEDCLVVLRRDEEGLCLIQNPRIAPDKDGVMDAGPDLSFEVSHNPARMSGKITSVTMTAKVADVLIPRELWSAAYRPDEDVAEKRYGRDLMVRRVRLLKQLHPPKYKLRVDGPAAH